MEQLQFLLDELRTMRAENSLQTEKINEKLSRIEIQTTKTNGKVISLENFKASASKDLETLKAAANSNRGRDRVIAFVFGVICSIAVTVLGWALSKI